MEKSPVFENLPFLYYSAFSKCKGVSRASSDHIIYFEEKKISWHQIFNLSNPGRKKGSQFSFVYLQIFSLKFQPVYKPYSF